MRKNEAQTSIEVELMEDMLDEETFDESDLGRLKADMEAANATSSRRIRQMDTSQAKAIAAEKQATKSFTSTKRATA